MRVDFDSLPVYLIRQERADTLRERVHSNAGRPQNEVARDLMLDGLAILILSGVRYVFWRHLSNTSRQSSGFRFA